MTFVLLLVLIGVGTWALSLASSRSKLRAENATFQTNNYGLYQQAQSLGGQLQYLQSERANLVQQLQNVSTENANLRQHLQHLSAENVSLAPYRQILDVQAEVGRMRASSAAELASAQQQAASIVGAAKGQATEIVSGAQGQAHSIAAEALAAKRNVETYRREALALQNVIAGYGDQYLVPRQTVLDGLAENYGHTEAGVMLKQARQNARSMMKSETAATCEYVEADRRKVAIAFVADAFNGKVEAILARAKADNFGTLRQELLDAFTLVNMNGRAFRNARITEAFRDARLDELRWAAAVHELKEREREEQRRMNEQIREEEKARRDFERAQRDAAKEEDVIRRAMERAQQEIAKATDSQRAQYEVQLKELAERLQAAEEKNQRALSMAQQTKRGNVYIISNVGSFGEQVFKIGLTRRLDPLDRVRELGDASVPFEFDVHAMIFSDDAPGLERTLHRHFLAAQVNKVNPRKEFFRAALATIRAEVESLGIQVSWTMLAAAEEYRESQAIEKAIKNDPSAYQAWINRQLVLEPVAVDPADAPPDPRLGTTTPAEAQVN
jgi:predicted nuclease with TOPRIM domain